ncbi:MAG TPA: FAD-binding and (Fe-S)-binding domain-containing protein [Casimicrobiaceae bacterium]|nr:FAD-binding and (Fe-S)-binding domain-containing protein [Casimicrobiaceae bacterium]
MTAKARPAPAFDAARLERRLREDCRGDVLFDAASRGRYATDASIYQVFPMGAVVPADAADLRIALEIARDEAVPLLPRGAGSSQCGQTVGEALVVDHSKALTAIGPLDRDAMTVSVEPGVVLDRLNASLAPYGIWFPVDVSTSAQATIGGMAGNNSCGSRSIEYGNMVHNVLGIDAVLADGSEVAFGPMEAMARSGRAGEIVRALAGIGAREHAEIAQTFPSVLRRVGGYNLDVFHPQSVRPYTSDDSVNLAHLLVGSEGTLAFFSRLTLKLAPLPAHKVLGVVSFPTFYRAMEAARHIVELKPTAVELVDRTMIDLARENPSFRPIVDAALSGEPEAILLVEFAGGDAAAQRARLDALGYLVGDLGLPGTVVKIVEPAAQKALWEVRKAGLNIMMSMKGDGKPVSFIEDCAVPLEHLADYTERLTEIFARHGTQGTWYAHASVGTLHVRPILDMRRDGAAKMRAIAEEAAAMVREYKGAYSGEHGDGLCRGEWVAWQFGPRIAGAFAEVKALFDPANRMNPGKIVSPPKMDDASLFRLSPAYRRVELVPRLDWSAWDVDRDPISGAESASGTGGDSTRGLAKAVEMCNNNGHCRKFDAGTMCPSYRATRDEQHVTRGRANTLRLALSGQLGGEDLGGEAVHAALELCVSCKGCKRECPTGVDMARFKIEALAAYRVRHRLTLGERLVAYLPRYAPRVAAVRGLVNRLERIAAIRGASARWLGFASERRLPRWVGDYLRAAASEPSTGAGREVVLFVDTFTNYFAPKTAHAARHVLEAAGYRVHLNTMPGERPLCCGRTFLAAGLVDEAKAEARRTLQALLPHLRRGVAIVGLEPSCLLGMRDEFLTYGLGEDAALLASRAQLLEEFLVREREAGRLRLDLKPMAAEALVHAHCHQKAFGAASEIQTVLGWIPDLAVRAIESSCCGMAGAFGYEAGHYDVSMRMAEAALLPAVRSAPPEALIVADGFSCRHQIMDGAQRAPLHAAVVLERALATPGSR